MKLLYLYIFDYEGIQNQGLNFHSDWRFEYDRDGKKLSWIYKPVLPDDFYGENSNVECISAIVDEAGVGKKAVARLFSGILSDEPDLQYVLVYQKEDDQKQNQDKLLIVYKLGDIQSNNTESRKGKGELSCRMIQASQSENQKELTAQKTENDGQETEKDKQETEYDVSNDFHFTYISPRFDLERMLIPISFVKEDLSVPEVAIELKEQSESINLNHLKNIDLHWIVDFLRDKKNRRFWETYAQNEECNLKITPNNYVFQRINTLFYKRVDTLKCKYFDCEKLEILFNRYENQTPQKKIFLCFLATCWYESIFMEEKFKLRVMTNLPDSNFPVEQTTEEQNDLLNEKISQKINQGLDEMLNNWEQKNANEILKGSRLLKILGAGKFFDDLCWYHDSYIINEAIRVPVDLDNVSMVLDSYKQAVSKDDFVKFGFGLNFSEGMLSIISILARVQANLVIHKSCVVYLNDMEMLLYPRDQRKLVKSFLEFFQNNYSNYHFHLIFASASPVLLSDIPIGNVSIFEEETDDYGKVVKPDGKPPKLKVREVKDVFQPNTFGASIFDLYSDFFSSSEGTFGEFATKKINELLDMASIIVKSDFEPERKLWLAKLQKRKQLIQLIGEKMIRHYLEEVQR